MSRADHPTQAIEIAAELYHTRAVVRRFYREKFVAVMASYGDAINLVAAGKGVSQLSAAKTLAEAANAQGDGMAGACFLAAAVELIEPTPEGHTDLIPQHEQLMAGEVLLA